MLEKEKYNVKSIWTLHKKVQIILLCIARDESGQIKVNDISSVSSGDTDRQDVPQYYSDKGMWPRLCSMFFIFYQFLHIQGLC